MLVRGSQAENQAHVEAGYQALAETENRLLAEAEYQALAGRKSTALCRLMQLLDPNNYSITYAS